MFQRFNKGGSEKTTTNWKQSLTLLGMVVAYLVMGGFCFQALEKTQEAEKVNARRRLSDEVLTRYANASGTSNMKYSTFEAVILKLVRQMAELKYKPKHYTKELNRKLYWDEFISGVIYAATVVTTIGYGDITVQNPNSMWLVVLYGSIGIPLYYIMLARLGSHMKTPLQRIIQMLYKGNSGKRFCNVYVNIGKERLLMVVMLAIGISLFLIAPAYVFARIEGWTFTEAFYYCFITLSTVGFGDYLIARKTYGEDTYVYQIIYEVVFASWVLLGLAWLSTFYGLQIEMFSKLQSNTKVLRVHGVNIDPSDPRWKDLALDPSKLRLAVAENFLWMGVPTTEMLVELPPDHPVRTLARNHPIGAFVRELISRTGRDIPTPLLDSLAEVDLDEVEKRTRSPKNRHISFLDEVTKQNLRGVYSRGKQYRPRSRESLNIKPYGDNDSIPSAYVEMEIEANAAKIQETKSEPLPIRSKKNSPPHKAETLSSDRRNPKGVKRAKNPKK